MHPVGSFGLLPPVGRVFQPDRSLTRESQCEKQVDDDDACSMMNAKTESARERERERESARECERVRESARECERERDLDVCDVWRLYGYLQERKL